MQLKGSRMGGLNSCWWRSGHLRGLSLLGPRGRFGKELVLALLLVLGGSG